MKSRSLDQEAVLQALAANLSDTTLEALFPGIAPGSIRDVLSGKQKIAQPVLRQQSLFRQSTPCKEPLSCKLFTDGASRGNPGEAGAGIVLLDKEDNEIAARSSYLGQCTNNVAEYEALLLGLKTARELNCSRLSIFMDSQLIVRQVSGRYKVKNVHLKPLFSNAMDLLKTFDTWSIAHVPRKQNKRADELANRGVDSKS